MELSRFAKGVAVFSRFIFLRQLKGERRENCTYQRIVYPRLG